MRTRVIDIVKVSFLVILLVSACSAFAIPAGPVPLPPDVNQLAAIPAGPVPLPPDAIPAGPVPLPPDAIPAGPVPLPPDAV